MSPRGLVSACERVRRRRSQRHDSGAASAGPGNAQMLLTCLRFLACRIVDPAPARMRRPPRRRIASGGAAASAHAAAMMRPARRDVPHGTCVLWAAPPRRRSPRVGGAVCARSALSHCTRRMIPWPAQSRRAGGSAALGPRQCGAGPKASPPPPTRSRKRANRPAREKRIFPAVVQPRLSSSATAFAPQIVE